MAKKKEENTYKYEEAPQGRKKRGHREERRQKEAQRWGSLQ